MNKNNMTKTRQYIIEQFLNCLKEERIPWEKTWQTKKPMNGISSHVYRGINNLLLSFIASERKYNDPRWLTFNQIKEKKWQLVNAKGQGVPIEYWSAYDIEEKKVLTVSEAQKIMKENTDRVKFIAKTYIVFNASLVDGIEPYISKSKKISNTCIKEFFDTYLYNENIRLKSGGDTACYVPESDEINIPEFTSFNNELDYFDTLAHEIAHSTGHKQRLNRTFGNFGSIDYAKEELNAEISSAFLNAELGIPAGPKRMKKHKAYIQFWISLLEEKPNELFKAIQEAEKISEYILEKSEYELIINNEENFSLSEI